jgi:hypothetical protein
MTKMRREKTQINKIRNDKGKDSKMAARGRKQKATLL